MNQTYSAAGLELGGTSTGRPALRGTRHMAVAGHYGAAHAAFSILEAGGNAVDAGVSAGIALAVLQCDLVNVGGVAPIILYDAREREVHTVSGLGHWPELTDISVFQKEHGGAIPEGVLRSVVPAAPAAWIAALRRFGTMSFGEVAAAAIRFARDGFPVYPLLADMIAINAGRYASWPSSASIFLPNGSPPKVGEIFRQADLAATLQFLADSEAAASKSGREAGLQAAHDAFYRGDIARIIADYHRENGGWLRESDLSGFEVGFEPSVKGSFAGTDIYTCGAWCQGPVLHQILNLLDLGDLQRLGLNSAAYIHHVAEAVKLAFADRERWYGDPRFVDVPLDRLLSPEYSASRRMQIRAHEAWPSLPPSGDPDEIWRPSDPVNMSPALPRDTSYIAVVDRHGNVFSATPSDVSFDSPVIPGTGLCASPRGAQSWTTDGHASRVAPGKRPRLTPSPAIAIRPGEFVLPFGSPGGDVQPQAMAQMLLNLLVFGMDPQQAVEMPRFTSYSFPDSFEPHTYLPGRLSIESRFPHEVGAELSRLGHDLEWWPDWTWRSGAVCAIVADLRRGTLTAGADPRRPCYAVGW